MNINALKITFAALAFFCTLSAAQERPVVNPYGKFLKGDGVEVEMAHFAEKNENGLYDVILKTTGHQAFNEGIDGKALRYKATHGGNGINYLHDGKVVMTLRQPYGDSWSRIQVYLNKKYITLNEDDVKSKDVRPLHLLTELQADK